ncbi:hypothetical protein LCGC14_0251260 [marine sediment metagenome]|uniref:Uncharacterized protein n=1 Tax=marine sediment metagenome TaxID=412755 RepID=A0A0F9U8X2_9ZZZZ
MNPRNYVVIAALLLAAPLAAQQTQTTVVPDVEVTVNGDTIVVNVEVLSDSVRLARIAEAVEAIAAAVAECGCQQPAGSSTVVRVGQGLLVVAAFLGVLQLKRIADREPDVHNDVTVPPHGHPKHDHGESPG